MKERPLISVVTPVYNGALFVRAAYDCLLRQSHPNWEWVVVDDGSTDDTARLMAQLAEGDSRISFIRQRGSGVPKVPRDRAVYESKGNLILPLDIDDKLADDYLELMYSRMVETNADIVYPQMVFVDFATGQETRRLPVADFDTTKVYAGRDLVRETMPDWRIGCNGGLYRRPVWTNMSYPEKKARMWMNSDENDERLYLLKARTVAFASAHYYYQCHPASTTTSFSPKLFHPLKTCQELLDLVEGAFGRDSEEYRRANRKAFGNWLTLAVSFIQHYRQLGGAESTVQRQLKECFEAIDTRLLSGRQRIKMLGTHSFQMVFAMLCLKHNPICLVEKAMQRLCPQWYTAHVLRRRNERRLQEQLRASYTHSDKGGAVEPLVVCMHCGNVRGGGLVDRLRGAVSTYITCRKAGRSFRLLFTHPFELTWYLQPNKYDWTIDQDKLSFAPEKTEVVACDALPDSASEYRHQRQQLEKALRSGKQTHVYSNASYAYADGFAQAFNELFRPTERLQQHLDNIRRDIGSDYFTVSARFGNLLDDFNEEVYSEPLPYGQREELLDSCIGQLAQLQGRHKGLSMVVCSDSATFLAQAREQAGAYVIDGNVSHIGNDRQHGYEYYEKNFLDFYTIAAARHAYLLRGAGMLGSGFPYAAALVGRKECETIHFE